MLTPHAPEAMNPPKRPTVLCIDDDAIVLRFFQAFLESSGYQARATTDGLQGLALARQDRPDMILLDVMMRGLSGFDICRRFRADPALRTIPIILLTVLSDPEVANTGREAGADLTLTKLADPETILTAIAQVLSERRAPPRG
jgi:putative two-component system response regulator